MHAHPYTVVDNFFSDPDAIREFALSLNFSPQPEGRWPGERTQNLHEIDPRFFRQLMEKISYIFADRTPKDFLEYSCGATFQKISADYNKGWVHADDPASLTCIVYLTPQGNINTGTSFFKLKNGVLPDWKYEEVKRKGTLDPSYRKSAEYNNALNYNNDQFEETMRVGGNYNRFIAFDSPEYHAANDFNTDEERLTMVLFFDKLNYLNTPPIARMRYYL